MYQLSQELEDAITSAFIDEDGIGRLAFWVSKFRQYAEPREYEHIKNYDQLIFMLMRNSHSNLAELEQNYGKWLHGKANSIMDGFAEMCADINVDYDDPDEWLQWLQGFDYLNNIAAIVTDENEVTKLRRWQCSNEASHICTHYASEYTLMGKALSPAAELA